MFRSIFVVGTVLASVTLVCGCGKATDPAVLAQRTKYLLTEEPTGALGVIEFRQQLGDDLEHSHEADASAADSVPVENPPKTEENPLDPDHAVKVEHEPGQQLASVPGAEVTLVGRIGGKPNPWSEGIAGFWIVDNTKEASADHKEHDDAAHGGSAHDPDTCPFCKQGKDNPKALAIVQFEDEQGKLLGIDARKLFDVSRNQTVVVRGHTRFDDLGNLVISASGLYIRE